MMDKLALMFTMLVCFLALTGSYAVFPYISRKTLSFGISIPESAYHDPKVVRIRKKYRNRIIISGMFLATIIILVTLILPADSAIPSVISGTLVIVGLVVDIFIYLASHKKMKKLKSESEWNENIPQLITVDTDFRNRKIMLSPLWFTLYILVIAATVAASLALYNTLPDKIPMKFNTAGEVTAWSQKSYKILLYIPVVQLFMTIIFMFAYYVIGKAKQQIDPANREKTLKQNIAFRRRWSVLIILFGLLFLIMFGFIQFSILGVIPIKYITVISSIIPIALVASIIILSVLSGQSGCKIKVDLSTERKAIVRDDDSNWKFGFIYCNPDDPSLFVEKRFGIGWTVNWGRPLSWIITFGLLALIVGFSVLVPILLQ